MSHVSKAVLRLSAFAILVSPLGACAKADEAKAAQSRQAQSMPGAARANNVRKDRSLSAENLLAAVAHARSAIARHNGGEARAQVSSAQFSLSRIQNMPLVPIYTELSEESVIGPVEAAKKNAASSRQSGAAPVAVRAVASGYSRILLDTSVAARELAAAKSALIAGNESSADMHLKNLEQSVVLETAATRLPLVRAREDLSLAASAANRGNWAGVKAQLMAASNGLGDYARLAPAKDLADVRVLQQQLSGYAANVEQKHADAASRINGWWVEAANLSDSAA